MPVAISGGFTVASIRDIERALEDLVKRYDSAVGRRAMVQALRASAAPIRTHIRGRAASRSKSGRLARSAAIVPARASPRLPPAVRIGYRFGDPNTDGRPRFSQTMGAEYGNRRFRRPIRAIRGAVESQEGAALNRLRSWWASDLRKFETRHNARTRKLREAGKATGSRSAIFRG